MDTPGTALKNLKTIRVKPQKTYNMVLAMGLYKEPRKIWRKKLSYEETWDDFKNFFTE